MKKYLAAGMIAIVSFSILVTALYARQKEESKYPLILNFYSIGTGTPGDQPLKDFVSAYRQKNKLPVLSATVVRGLGREGEYAILFPLKELTASQQKIFIDSLSQVLPALGSKNGNGGGIALSKNQSFNTSRGRGTPQTTSF